MTGFEAHISCVISTFTVWRSMWTEIVRGAGRCRVAGATDGTQGKRGQAKQLWSLRPCLHATPHRGCNNTPPAPLFLENSASMFSYVYTNDFTFMVGHMLAEFAIF